MALIKDIYSKEFYDRFSKSLAVVRPGNNAASFTRKVMNKNFAGMEWKERMQHTTVTLHDYLPEKFPAAARTITKLIRQLRKDGWNGGLEFMFLPDYIATYGLDHFDASAEALEEITQFISAEFAVRPFLLKYGQRMLEVMTGWSMHPHYAVRRLASEGSRPRLPWAMAIPSLKADPAPLFPLLENLKTDPHEWVRRSVANHINDIAKDHPHVVLQFAKNWKNISAETDGIIRHGSRTLLKKGHPEILAYFGLDDKGIGWQDFTIHTPKVKEHDKLKFSFSVQNQTKKPVTIRLEYAVHFLRANGQLSPKVFKISERSYAAGELVTLTREHSFKPITTRVYYQGPHKVSLIINGREKEVADFVYGSRKY
ncbi:DNA alkylation repair protein [Terrimonas ferruginea]|uniref:DNA alkylation repair protein n=1 Tax=Terrimonas ferruginea TaxID=249 RepID=UPI00040C9150|nr:DNA alkylation repair protein [Terrimonas ferruginea]